MSVLTSGASVIHPHNVINNPTQIPVKEYNILGKMLKCESMITMEEWERHPAKWVKEKMIRLMVDEMMKEHCIEFTMEKSQHEMNMVRVRARVFVTPDDQVRLLREKGNL